MITAIAIDDEPPALKVIEKFCNDTDFIQLQKSFTKPQEALKFLKKYPADLLFLDIQMPSIQGLEFYKHLETPVMVIFTTAFPEYAVEGFNVNAIDYLLKPYTYERFLHAVQKAIDLFQYSHSHSSQSNRCLLVRVDYSLQRIMFDTILMIEGLDDYLKIHVIDSKPLVVRMTMKSVLEKLPQNEFVRVHKSFIVAINKIASIRNKTITIQDKQIPIGSKFEENFQRQFKF